MASILQTIGLGQFAGNGHPVHPATVHFPISFLSLAYALDVLYGLATSPTTGHLTVNTLKTVNNALSLHINLNDISRVAYYSNLIGIITAIPAVLSGGAEMFAMIQGQGVWEKIKRESDGKEISSGINPKVKHGALHGILNEGAIAASLFNWWSRRSVPGYEPSSTNVWISALVLPTVMFSAYLGGSLVYEYGVGVQRQGVATKIKEKQGKDELKKKDGLTQVKERKGE